VIEQFSITLFKHLYSRCSLGDIYVNREYGRSNTRKKNLEPDKRSVPFEPVAPPNIKTTSRSKDRGAEIASGYRYVGSIIDPPGRIHKETQSNYAKLGGIFRGIGKEGEVWFRW